MGTEKDDLGHAVDLFNSGRYYEAHEVLERLWADAEVADRPLYQGVLQVAVGLYHAERGNFKGADALLRRGLSRLEGLSVDALGVGVLGLREQTKTAIGLYGEGATAPPMVVSYTPRSRSGS